MRCLAWILLGLFGAFVSVVQAQERGDWDAWRSLPVRHGGRHKPLDTVARELLRMLANRSRVADPQTGEDLDATAWYVGLLMEWRGWDHPHRDELRLFADGRPLYTHLHGVDRWDAAPWLCVDFVPLRALLQPGGGPARVAASFLDQAQVEPPGAEQPMLFSEWANGLLERDQAGDSLTLMERKGLELAVRWWTYQDHRMGRGVEVLPLPGQGWMSLAGLVLTKFDGATDPSGELRQLQAEFWRARTAFCANNAAAFQHATRAFVDGLRRTGSGFPDYPGERWVALEVAHNRWMPFRIAWVLMLLAVAGLLLHRGCAWRPIFAAGFVAYLAGLSAAAVGLGLRVAIAGRPPVTNMYESVIYVGAGTALLGGIFYSASRRTSILLAAATIATLALIVADSCPLILDPSVRPLEPVLRSNFWLITHVMTITLSYAAFALALGIGNITLGCYLFGCDRREVIVALSRYTYRATQIGVLLLAAGIVLGGVWADYAWGRFWGWDPKEVWALVALLGYLAVLHARFAGWVSHRGLAALSVGCFALVVMAWYGVNFILGAGLHSYGFGGGGEAVVFLAVGLQLLYALAGVLRPVRIGAPHIPLAAGTVAGGGAPGRHPGRE